ncbi:MAG: chemotaxis protein CheW [Pseudomonadota bacterium]|nr:MAG: chemotaxis protein CheW [Pseudomonadota bacterium]
MSETEVRSVLVPLTGVDMLLPNATVAEIVNYSEPEPIPDAVDWVLGTVVWQGWQVPVISFARLAEESEQEPSKGKGARLCIIKTLIDRERMPYMAILAQGKPRLATITEDNFDEITSEGNPIAVAGRVSIEGREALIPDLDRLGHLVAHAAFGALPLTG